MAYSKAALRPLAGLKYVNMLLFPDDNETCVAELGKTMAAKEKQP